MKGPLAEARRDNGAVRTELGMIPALGVGVRTFAITGIRKGVSPEGLAALPRRRREMLIYCGEALDRLAYLPP